MSRVIHLSDLHFGTESPPVLAALKRQISQLSPDVVVISGDLTQRARKREFLAARQFIAALDAANCEVILVPGNHDIPLFNPIARLFWPFKRYRKAFGSTGVKLSKVGKLRFITVNSVRRERHASGYITAQRGREVAEHGRHGQAGEVTIVVTHHPLGTTALGGGNTDHQGDAQTCRLWQKAGINLVMSGHVHRPFLLDATEQLIEGARGNGNPLWILNAGTAVSHRVRDDYPNSFNLLHFTGENENRTLLVERWDYSTPGSRFELHQQRTVSLC